MIEGYDGHRLSVQEAREVTLPRNPIKRLGQLAEYGAAFGLLKVGFSPLPQYMTRGDLIRTAEARESAEAMLAICNEAELRDQQSEI